MKKEGLVEYTIPDCPTSSPGKHDVKLLT